MSKAEVKAARLHSYRNWCLTVVDYIVEVEPSAAAMFSQFRKVIEGSFSKGNLRGFKSIKQDLNEFIGDLSKAQQLKLNEMLSSIDFERVDLGVSRANQIIESRAIGNDDEYRLLCQYVDILLDKDDFETIAKVNNLLVDYHLSQ